jgi:hypothetical protein
MARGKKHYHKKLRRRAIDGTTARHLSLEQHPDGFYVVVSEVGPTRDNAGDTTDYDLHSVLWKRYPRLEEGISAAEMAFYTGLRMGFHEVVADTQSC